MNCTWTIDIAQTDEYNTVNIAQLSLMQGPFKQTDLFLSAENEWFRRTCCNHQIFHGEWCYFLNSASWFIQSTPRQERGTQTTNVIQHVPACQIIFSTIMLCLKPFSYRAISPFFQWLCDPQLKQHLLFYFTHSLASAGPLFPLSLSSLLLWNQDLNLFLLFNAIFKIPNIVFVLL